MAYLGEIRGSTPGFMVSEVQQGEPFVAYRDIAERGLLRALLGSGTASEWQMDNELPTYTLPNRHYNKGGQDVSDQKLNTSVRRMVARWGDQDRWFHAGTENVTLFDGHLKLAEVNLPKDGLATVTIYLPTIQGESNSTGEKWQRYKEESLQRLRTVLNALESGVHATLSSDVARKEEKRMLPSYPSLVHK